MPESMDANPTSAPGRAPLARRLSGLALTGTLVLSLAAAGCGSKKSSSLTKPQFLAKANAICTRGNKQTDVAGAKLGKNPTPAQVAAVVKGTFVPSIQGQINAIRALGGPSGDKATVTKMLDLAQADIDKVKADPALIAGQASPFADFAKLAHPYGLKACAPNG